MTDEGLISKLYKQLIQLNIKNKQANKQKNPKQPNLKLGRRPEQTFFKRRHTDGQQAHEKMYNNSNHQKNVTQNPDEILPHNCQNGYHQKDHN